MEKENLISSFHAIFEEGKLYLKQRIDLTKLEATEKIVILASMFFTFLTVLLLFIYFWLFLSFSLAIYLGSIWQNNALGFLAMSGIYLIFMVLLIVLRKKIITKPILKAVLKIIFKSKFTQKDIYETENTSQD